jgi:MoaA/NifB/PqqE/SkfB family radical SAM enzyme
MDYDKLINSDSFCLGPWITLKTYFNYYSPCPCEARDYSFIDENDLTKHSYKDIINSKKYNDLRLALLNDDRNHPSLKRCYDCKRFANNNIGSYREWTNKYWKDNIKEILENTNEDGSLKEIDKVKFLPLTLNNICNFKCRFCDAERSSSLEKEFNELKNKNYVHSWKGNKQLPKMSTDVLNSLTEEIEKTEVLHFSCAGEPFLTSDHLNILINLINKKLTNKHLIYHTNLSVINYKNLNILEILNNFSKVTLLISMDGLDPYNQIIRGTNIEEKIIKHNIMECRKTIKNLELNLHSSICVYNIFHITDFHKHMYENGYIDIHEIYLNPVTDWDQNTQSLPIELKQKINEKFDKHLYWLYSLNDSNKEKTNFYFKNIIQEFSNFKLFINKIDDSKNFGKIISEIKILDEYRKLNSFEQIPELKEFLKYE